MAMPPAQVPMLSPAEMQILVSRTGLVLNPGQVADLVLAWRQVAGLIASLPQNRPLADDMALTFRLPPPSPTAQPAAESPDGPAVPKTASLKDSNEKAGAHIGAAQRVGDPGKASAKATARTGAAQMNTGEATANQANVAQAKTLQPKSSPKKTSPKASGDARGPKRPAPKASEDARVQKRPAAKSAVRSAASEAKATARRPAGARAAPKR